MKPAWLSRLLVVAVAAGGLSFGGAIVANHGAEAVGSSPKPSRKCSKFRRGSKKWKRCKRRASLSDKEIYFVGYTLAKQKQYQAALDFLHTAENKNDPLINNYIGFSMRKLGDVDGALVFYNKVIKTAPNYTLARAYMGEAFIQKGDLAGAKAQLAEIAKRCGTSCAEYDLLKKEIAKAEA